MTFPGHVAVVGCGFTGTSAFFQLVDGYPVRKITLFEASGRFGPGFAYQPEECRDYLINNTNDTMCLSPTHRRAFVDWLAGRPDLVPQLDEKGHLPRSIFGLFLEDVVAATRTVAAIKGIEVVSISAEVTRMWEDSTGKVHLGWGETEIEADAVILAIGRCPDLVAGLPRKTGETMFYPSHLDTPELNEIPIEAEVHILGASLSAYDVVNRLFSATTGCRFEVGSQGDLSFVPGQNRRKVVLCSRSGRLKKMQSRARQSLDRTHFTRGNLRRLAAEGKLSLSKLAELIQLEAQAHGSPVNWSEVTDPYRDCRDSASLQQTATDLLAREIRRAQGAELDNFLVDFLDDAEGTIWDLFGERLLEPNEEQTYRDKYENALLLYGAACPIPTAEKLLALMRAGRLRVLRDTRIVEDDTGRSLWVAHAFGKEPCRYLIDATGRTDRRVTSERQPALIQNLLRRGLLAPYRLSGKESYGAAVDMATFRSEASRNIYLANMLLWGPGFFTSSAYVMATIVQKILAAMASADSSD